MKKKKGVIPDFSHVLEEPSAYVRIEIEKVFSRFRGGVHKSAIAGSGIEFRSLRPYDPSDSFRAIDALASARFSDYPDIEPLSRTYSTEQEVAVTVVLDIGESMRIPPQKQVHGSRLLWLFLLSAFRYGDRARVILYGDDGVFDSEWLYREESMREFVLLLMQRPEQFRVKSTLDIYAHLEHLSLRDSLVVMISDFCVAWEHEADALRRIGSAHQNIHIFLVALDEWAGFVPMNLGVAIGNTSAVKGVLSDMRPGGEVDRLAAAARIHLTKMKESIRPLSIPVFCVPLIQDPLDSIFQSFMRGGV